MDRGTWKAIVRGVARSLKQLKVKFGERKTDGMESHSTTPPEAPKIAPGRTLPSRQSRGIDPPVTIRRAEGA